MRERINLNKKNIIASASKQIKNNPYCGADPQRSIRFSMVEVITIQRTTLREILKKRLVLSGNLTFYQHPRINFYFEDLKYARRPV